MKQNKLAIIVTAPVALMSLILAYIFNQLGVQGGFWSNVMLGVFGSALLGLITAIINYAAERKNVMDAFFMHYVKALNNFRRFLNNRYPKGPAEIDITIETILRMDEFDYFPLDDTFRNMSFLFNNKNIRNRIFERMYQPIVELHRKIIDSVQVIENYRIGNLLTDERKKELIELLDDCSDVTIAGSIISNKRDGKVRLMQVIGKLQENADEFYNNMMYPSKAKERKNYAD